MQLNLEKNTVKTAETVFEATPEQGFETDILLPDYCADITRILKCNAISKISQCSQNGNHIDIDGSVFVTVYYLSDENKLNSYSTRLPFSKTVTVNDNGTQLTAHVNSQIQYLNCRAVNSRRLDIRGAVTISVQIFAPHENAVVCSCDEVVQLRKTGTSTLCDIGEICRTFSVKEEVQSQTGITAILRTCATAMPTEVKAINNKLIIKGEMSVCVVSKNDQDEINSATYTIPVSQIADLDGVGEDSVVSVDFDVASLDVTHTQGESQTLEINAKILLTATAKTTCNVTVCDDCYGIRNEVIPKTEKVTLTQLCEHIDEIKNYKNTFSLPENDNTVCDLWFEEKPITQTFENGTLTLNLPVVVSIISKNGECHYTEQTLPIIETKAVPNAENAMFDGTARVCDCRYNIMQNSVEVVLTVRFCGNIIAKKNQSIITDIECFDDKTYADSDSALTIYFATENESLWEIAKRYHTKKEAIANANNIDGDRAPATTLLIPTVM